mmetsp:Transcript_27168/g.35619  ORF Transcript_27168/g.35619 Transcript_27168/m.35619 type:complete len:720 (-) Transcript_27168:324-2483(-)
MIYFWLLVIASVLVLILLGAFLEILVLSLLPDGFFIKKKKYSYPIKGSEDLGKGLGATHRNPESLEGLILTLKGASGITSMYEVMKQSASQYGDVEAYGWREIEVGADGKSKAGPYKWHTYSKFYERAKDFGAGLMHLNLIPKVDGMRLLGMYLQNCPEWIIAEAGLMMFSGVTVPLYDTLGSDAVEYILGHTETETVVCGAPQLKNLVQAGTKKLKHVVVVGNADNTVLDECKKKGLKMFTFAEVEAAGAGKDIPHEPPTLESPLTFCYTSGTTGPPKGALITHQNLIAEITGSFKAGLGRSAGERYLSYLPLAHIMERAVLAVGMFGGASVGFFQGDTRLIVDDLLELRPHAFVSVPRLLNKVHDKIAGGVQKKVVAKVLFNTAIFAKKLRMRKLGTTRHAFWDALVFNKVAAKVGLNRCTLIVSGSAPLASHVLEFLRLVFPAKVIEGYGQTESTGASTVQSTESLSLGDVGGPMVINEVRLESIPEMGYNITDTVHGADLEHGVKGIPCEGRGEICIKGYNIFMGYYKDQKKTEEAVDKDGWCHTGDIGIWLPDGALKIVDRKKNIFKLAQGEYVAPEKIENIYGQSTLVAQSFVYGDSFQAYLVGVVVPDPDGLVDWCNANGGDPQDIAALCKREDLKKDILTDLTKIARASKLHGYEIVKAVHLEADPFTYENGLLTNTFKLKRNIAKQTFQKQIDAMYSTLGGVAGQQVKQN